jgi:hypothetical protein
VKQLLVIVVGLVKALEVGMAILFTIGLLTAVV